MTTLNRKFLEALARASLEADTSSVDGRSQFRHCVEYIKSRLVGMDPFSHPHWAYRLQIAADTALACARGKTWAAAREAIENVVGDG